MSHELDRLLAADRQELQRKTECALQGGLLYRLSATLDRRAGRQPLRLSSGFLVPITAVFATVLLVMTMTSSRWTGRKGHIPLPEVATVIPAPEVTALPQRASASTLRKVSSRRPAKVQPRVRQPFPTPTPLSKEERTLLLIAQASPRDRDLVLEQQQQMNREFEEALQQFRAKIQRQGEDQ
jgi:hypothetical protein